MAGTTADKLQGIIDAKADIANAITTKGGTVPSLFEDYGDAIRAIPSGGGGGDKFGSLVDKSITTVTASDLSGVTTIGDYAFYTCSSLTSVTIPNSVTSIGSFAFFNTGLTSVTIPDSVTSIGGNAFQGCTGLTSVTVPNSVTSTGNGVFYSCSGLTSVIIGNGLTSISQSTFRYCSSCLLYDFRSAQQVPTLVNTNAFNNTNANKKIVVPDALYDTWVATNNWNSSTNGIVGAITRASDYNP